MQDLQATPGTAGTTVEAPGREDHPSTAAPSAELLATAPVEGSARGTSAMQARRAPSEGAEPESADEDVADDARVSEARSASVEDAIQQVDFRSGDSATEDGPDSPREIEEAPTAQIAATQAGHAPSEGAELNSVDEEEIGSALQSEFEEDLPIFASDASAASPPSGSEDAPAVQVQRSISGDQEAEPLQPSASSPTEPPQAASVGDRLQAAIQARIQARKDVASERPDLPQAEQADEPPVQAVEVEEEEEEEEEGILEVLEDSDGHESFDGSQGSGW